MNVAATTSLCRISTSFDRALSRRPAGCPLLLLVRLEIVAGLHQGRFFIPGILQDQNGPSILRERSDADDEVPSVGGLDAAHVLLHDSSYRRLIRPRRQPVYVA